LIQEATAAPDVLFQAVSATEMPSLLCDSLCLLLNVCCRRCIC
jgi:hypothetical protein